MDGQSFRFGDHGRYPALEHLLEISIIQGDLLDSDAQALALTIDGSAPNLEGNIARQFSKRFPNEWAQIESQIDYPMSLGAADSFTFETTNDKCPELVVLLSTLHHDLSLGSSEKQAVAASAVRSALSLSKSNKMASLACPLMTGGWRQQPDRAALQTINTYFRASISTSLPSLELHINDGDTVGQVVELLTSQSYLRIETEKNRYLVHRA